MNQPTLSIIPMYSEIAAGRPITLDILIKIEPPAIKPAIDRPPLNLGFVLDRSGSMKGTKINYARKAIAYALEHLLPSDRLSLTLFDTHVTTKIPSTLATDKQTLLNTIRSIQTGSSTALHAGWANGGMQVSQYLNPEQLNRVILVSDGLANVGETNPDTIATDVHGLAKRGVTTTTLGVGADYDEDLLEAMARSGDGNFFHIDSPKQLPGIFETEMQALSSLVGQSVTLTVTPLADVTIAEVVNNLKTTESGALKLANLIVGISPKVVLRVHVPALSESKNILKVKLAWQPLQETSQHSLESALLLEIVSLEQMQHLAVNPEVQEQVALMMGAKTRREAVQIADRGDWEGAASCLERALNYLEGVPRSTAIKVERATVKKLIKDFRGGDRKRARKTAVYDDYTLSFSGPTQFTIPRNRVEEDDFEEDDLEE